MSFRTGLTFFQNRRIVCSTAGQSDWIRKQYFLCNNNKKYQNFDFIIKSVLKNKKMIYFFSISNFPSNISLEKFIEMSLLYGKSRFKSGYWNANQKIQNLNFLKYELQKVFLQKTPTINFFLTLNLNYI